MASSFGFWALLRLYGAGSRAKIPPHNRALPMRFAHGATQVAVYKSYATLFCHLPWRHGENSGLVFSWSLSFPTGKTQDPEP